MQAFAMTIDPPIAQLSHTPKAVESALSAPPALRVGAVSHVGRVRKRNEDHWLARPNIGLFAVADGMGGHRAGDIASAMAINELDATALNSVGPAQIERVLRRSFRRANRQIYTEGQTIERLGMGTTAVATWFTGRHAYVAHVGDSRLYQQRDRALSRITLDHSVVGDAVRNGLLDRATSETLPAPPMITRSLGAGPGINVEIQRISTLPGDRYLLCSDGLSDMVADADLLYILRTQLRPQDAAAELLRAALDQGGHDNVTIVVIDVD